MTTATTPSEKEIDEVHTLSAAAIAAVQSASSPAVTLNALLTAYINVASAAGMLEQVPGAGVALGQAAKQMLALQSQLNTAPPGAPIH